jgi:hypothetical protein
MTVTIQAAAVAGPVLAHAGAAGALPGRGLGLAALITWLVDAGSGLYMLGTWISRGGLRRQRASDRLAPRVVFGHFGMASTGLLVWISFLATGLRALAWLAVGLLMLVIGFGISTVTLWTPFPAHRGDPGAGAGPDPAPRGTGAFTVPEAIGERLTDETLARALDDEVLLARLVDEVVASVPADPSRPGRTPRPHLAAIVPAGHGLAAIATFLLAVLTAVAITR